MESNEIHMIVHFLKETFIFCTVLKISISNDYTNLPQQKSIGDTYLLTQGNLTSAHLAIGVFTKSSQNWMNLNTQICVSYFIKIEKERRNFLG